MDARIYEYYSGEFLPPKFARGVEALVDKNIYLEDTSGGHWKVSLSVVDGSLAFLHGWREFVSDHSIEVGEMIVFNYIVESHFIVQIYGTSGCERLDFSESSNVNHHKVQRTTAKPSSDHPPGLKAGRNGAGMGGKLCAKELRKQVKAMTKRLHGTCSDLNLSDSEKPSSDCPPGLRAGGFSNSTGMLGKSFAKESTKEIKPMPRRLRATFSAFNLSDSEATKCKFDTEDTETIPTKMKLSSEYGSCSRKTSGLKVGRCSGGTRVQVEALPQRTCRRFPTLNMSDSETSESKSDAEDTGTLPTEPKASSKYGSTSGRNSDAPDAHSPGNEDKVTEEGAAKNRISLKALNSSAINIVDSESSAEDIDKLPISTEKSSHYCKNSRKVSNVEEPCCLIDADKITEEGCARSQMTYFNSSHFEMTEGNCDTEDMGRANSWKENSNENCSHHSSGIKRNRDGSDVKCHTIDEDSMSEDGEIIRGSDSEDVERVPKSTEKASHCSNCLKKTLNSLEVPGYIVDGDLQSKEPISRSRIAPQNLTKSRAIANKCGVPAAKFLGNHYSSKQRFNMLRASQNLIGKDSLDKEISIKSRTGSLNLFDNEIIESKWNAKDVETALKEKSSYSSLKSILDPLEEQYKTDEDSINEEEASKMRTDLKLPDLETVKHNCDAKDVVEVLGAAEKSYDYCNRSKSTSNASETPSCMMDKGSANKRATTRNIAAPTLLIGRKLDDEEMGKLPGRTEELLHYDNIFGSHSSASWMDFTENEKELLCIPSLDICHSSLQEEQKGGMSEYAPDVGASPSPTVKNVSECNGYSLTKEDKYCQSEKNSKFVLERNERDIKCTSEGVLNACKIEKDDSTDSIDHQSPKVLTFSCSVSVNTRTYLELPTNLPFSLTKNKRHGRMVVFLCDPSMRMWPILYHETRIYKHLGFGWTTFAKENNIRQGDVCTFDLSSSSQDSFLQVSIDRG